MECIVTVFIMTQLLSTTHHNLLNPGSISPLIQMLNPQSSCQLLSKREKLELVEIAQRLDLITESEIMITQIVTETGIIPKTQTDTEMEIGEDKSLSFIIGDISSIYVLTPWLLSLVRSTWSSDFQPGGPTHYSGPGAQDGLFDFGL